MSSPFSKPAKLRRALNGKGFKDKGSGRDHHWMVLVVDDKLTTIKTKVSRGSKEIPKKLFKALHKQLKMPDNTYFVEYLECSKTYTDYVEDLRVNEHL